MLRAENISEKDRLLGLVDAAIDSFNREEQYLLINDLSERCMCARLAMHLSRQLEGTVYKDYFVDVEYNRGADGKERNIKHIESDKIVVDLIVHQRGFNFERGFDNLICIEMKKSTNPQGRAKDEERLKKMVDASWGFGYHLGVMLVADMREKKLIRKTVFPNY